MLVGLMLVLHYVSSCVFVSVPFSFLTVSVRWCNPFVMQSCWCWVWLCIRYLVPASVCTTCGGVGCGIWFLVVSVSGLVMCVVVGGDGVLCVGGVCATWPWWTARVICVVTWLVPLAIVCHSGGVGLRLLRPPVCGAYLCVPRV